jgi:hypothetical protein
MKRRQDRADAFPRVAAFCRTHSNLQVQDRVAVTHYQPAFLLDFRGEQMIKLNISLLVRECCRWTVFDNKQLAIGNWQLARKPNPFHFATLCRPNSKNRKTGLKLGQIGALKNGKKSFDRSVDRTVEWHFGFCFQQSAMGGGVPG